MKLKKLFDRTLALYVIIGVLNFIVCTLLMFILYNAFGTSRHVAPIVNYGLGSVIWYVCCRYIIFPNRETTKHTLTRFVLAVALCYLISYYTVSPMIAGWMLKSESVVRFFAFTGRDSARDNCEMSVGALVYALGNYFGQRYFVFKSDLAE